MPYTIAAFGNPAELTNAVAAEFWRVVLQAREEGKTLAVALSGGRSAAVLFDAIAAAPPSSDAWKAHIEIFWADERCVPPDHPESNYGLAHARLLAPLGFPQQRVHRVPGEKPPREAAQIASTELGRILAGAEKQDAQLDLVILSMGEDGHIASLFPNAAAEVVEYPGSYLPVEGPKPPPNRITLGYAPLLQADQVWVMASGSGKEGVLRASLERPPSTPLGRVLHGRKQSLLFTDLLRAQASLSTPRTHEGP